MAVAVGLVKTRPTLPSGDRKAAPSRLCESVSAEPRAWAASCVMHAHYPRYEYPFAVKISVGREGSGRDNQRPVHHPVVSPGNEKIPGKLWVFRGFTGSPNGRYWTRTSDLHDVNVAL